MIAVSSNVSSQIDVLPSLLAMLGLPGQEQLFGHDMLETGASPQRAFISNYQEIGYYKNDTLVVLAPNRKVEAFSVDPQTGIHPSCR